ncbi:MAG: hypothetical protein V1863_00770 [Candidatus Omnitrophota bacterium]
MTLVKKSCVFFFLAFLFASGTSVFAQQADDGFGPAKKTEAQHFSVYYKQQLDPSSLARQLDVSATDSLLAGKPVGAQGSADTELAAALDVLFSLVCDVLDMQLYSYKGKIKICLDEGQLKILYNNLYGKDPPNSGHVGSFYVHELNTIYVTKESFQRNILGHEIGHAVISNYFVVQPSIKIQEVLAGYIEYQLRKSTP